MRLIGIDTPELDQKPHGRLAAEALERMLAVGDTVTLEFDVQSRDRHGRQLAYVWRGGAMLNLAMVREGYALPFTVPPNVRYEALFRAAQREAREAKAGLWGEDGFACAPQQFRRGQCGK